MQCSAGGVEEEERQVSLLNFQEVLVARLTGCQVHLPMLYGVENALDCQHCGDEELIEGGVEEEDGSE